MLYVNFAVFLFTKASGLISTTANSNCPSDILTFECTVEGGVATVWKGTVFNLCEDQEISLLQSSFNDINGVRKLIHCSNVTIYNSCKEYQVSQSYIHI